MRHQSHDKMCRWALESTNSYITLIQQNSKHCTPCARQSLVIIIGGFSVAC